MKTQIDSNIELFYEAITPVSLNNDKTTLLFLHEALGSIGQWKSFPKDLCDTVGLKGIVYERQGHGSSSPFNSKRNNLYLHDYALKELPQFIASTIDGSQEIILVGHSDGGTIALLYAHKFGARIKGVITMAAHVINEVETIAGIEPAIEAYKAGKLNGLVKYHGDKTEDLFYAWANIWRDISFKDWDITHEIGANCPHLCLQGEDDQYGTVKQLELLEVHANAKIDLIPSCGHHPHLESKAKSISSIVSFIETNNLI